MSDFLSRLADRTLGRAPFVDPLVRSRYVPALELEVDAEVSPSFLPIPRRVDHDAAPPAGPAPTVDPEPVAAVLPAGTRPPEPTLAHLRAQPGREAPPTAPETGASVEVADVPPASRAAAPPAAAHPPAVGPPHRTPRPVSRRREQSDDRQPTVEPLPAQPGPLPGRRKLVSPEPTLGPSQAEAGPGAEAAPLERAFRVGVPRPADPAAAPPRALDAPEPFVPAPRRHAASSLALARYDPQPVHVTIGRVEVRAPAASPPPAPAPQRGPALSLDEYLRTRGGVGS
jgi:hypothetical protein